MADLQNPHHLHATAALWSLRASRRSLNDEIVAWRHELATDDDATLRSPRYGARAGSGGHSDPVGDSLVSAADQRYDRWRRLADRTTDTLAWLAGRLKATGAGDPLGRLHTVLPTVTAVGAEHLHRWLTDLDARIRRALGLDHARQPLVGQRCPACRVRQLHHPISCAELYLIVCGETCPCAGDACPCAMPIRVKGVQHIWVRQPHAIALA